MKKKQLVCSALAAAMMLSTAAPGASAASFSDSDGHWGESSIDRWSNSGVLNGIDNAFNPNASITRGEMATILAEMLGLEERASDTYPDLNGGWYTDAMLKCAAAGIMTGDDHGQMRPYDSVTGAEIAVILNKALDLSSSRSNYPATTAGYVKPWAQSYVDAITSRGIAVGNDGGIFQPMEATSRAAFVSMLDRAVDTYISSPGTYSADGLTIINTTGTVTLTGTPTSVDITASSTGANVVLDRTHVSGPINVKGGRVHLTARSATLNDTQVKGYGCSIALEGNTNGGTVQLSSGAGSTSVSIASTAQAGQIISDASSTTIDIYGDVNNIKLDSGAMSSSINVRSGAKVESVTSEANDVNISGNGTLRRADIYGTNNRVTTPGTTINRGPTTSTVTNTSKRSVVRRRPSYSDRYTVNFYYDDGSGNSHRLYTSSRVYNGNTVGTVSEPIYNGDKIFDHWEYERYYYDDGYYYDYYYYDWDYWYKDGNWVWDSSEQAYHLRSSDLWYDSSRNEYFVLRNGRRVVVSGSSLYDYYDRYGYYYDGYYYDGGYWRESDNWVWSRAKNAYYNSFGDVYHDSNGYFIMSSGSKRYISASEARDRLGAYYYDDYYYRNGYYRDGYYKDGRWYYYDKNGTYRDGYYKDGRWYYYDSDRYYYNYRVGDTFSFSDRIYGNVDLVARWRSCVTAGSLAELQTILNNTGDTLPIKYTGNDPLTSSINMNDRELYMVSNVSTSGVTNASKITGPGSNGSNGSGGSGNTGGNTGTMPGSLIESTSNTAFAGIGAQGVGTNSNVYTVTSGTQTTRTQKLEEVAGKLLALRKSLGTSIISMTVNGQPVSTTANVNDIVSLIRGSEPSTYSSRSVTTDTNVGRTTVVITYSDGGSQTSITYYIDYLIDTSATEEVADRVSEMERQLSSSSGGANIKKGTSSANKNSISTALVIGDSSKGDSVVVEDANHTALSADTDLDTIKHGATLYVYTVTTDGSKQTKTLYSTVTFIAVPSSQATSALTTFTSGVSSLLSGTTITLKADADPTILKNALDAAAASGNNIRVNSNVTLTDSLATSKGGTITMTDTTNDAPVGEYTVVISAPAAESYSAPFNAPKVVDEQRVALQQAVDTAQSEVDTAQDAATTAQRAVTTAREKVSAAQSKYDDAVAAVQRITESNAGVETRKQTLNETISGLNTQISSLEQKIAALNNTSVPPVAQGSEGAGNNEGKKQSEVPTDPTAGDTGKTVAEQIADLNARIADLRTQVSNAQNELDGLQTETVPEAPSDAELNAAKAELQQAEEKLQQAENALNLAKTKLSQAQSALDDYDAQNQ